MKDIDNIGIRIEDQFILSRPTRVGHLVQFTNGVRHNIGRN
jgi:hypothetical protein